MGIADQRIGCGAQGDKKFSVSSTPTSSAA
jgi:hypothetical protein